MILIIGLGNPGKKYTETRHNVGFFFLEELRQKLGLPPFRLAPKFKSEIAQDTDIILAKPQTFMNASGESAATLVNFYKINPENLWLIHDDLDIPLAQYRLQKNKSAAGHKGVQSIINALGTQDFNRVRIGIQTARPSQIPAEAFVLEKFTAEEQKNIAATIKKALDEIIPMLKSL